jgi:hypothetical protein
METLFVPSYPRSSFTPLLKRESASSDLPPLVESLSAVGLTKTSERPWIHLTPSLQDGFKARPKATCPQGRRRAAALGTGCRYCHLLLALILSGDVAS